MFQFPGLSSPRLWIRRGDARTAPCGFAHSETPGSSGVCPYPGIFAACRVLRRLPMPRHPPRALRILRPAPRRGARSLILSKRRGPEGPLRDSYRVSHTAGPLGASAIVNEMLLTFKMMLQIGCISSSPIRESIGSVLDRFDPSRYAALKVRGVAPGTGRCEAREGRTRTGDTRRQSELGCLPKNGLPRKEVIQPHVPVRLPCYDFTPLTLHTFGASPQIRLGRRLRVQTTRVV